MKMLATHPELSQLQVINIEETAVSNKGLAALLALPKLEVVYISDVNSISARVQKMYDDRKVRLKGM